MNDIQTKELECESCKQKSKTVHKRKVKEEGVLGYYEVEVCWCDSCVDRHNYCLMANWG